MDKDGHNSNEVTLNFDKLSGDDISMYSTAGIVIVDDVSGFKRVVLRSEGRVPLRVEMNALMLCLHGELRFKVNDEDVTVRANSLMLTPSHVVVSQTVLSDDADCLLLYMSNHVMNQLLGSEISEWNRVVFHNRIRVISLSYKDVETITMFHSLIRRQMLESKSYSDIVIQSILQAALYDILGNCKEINALHENQMALHSNQLFNQFLELLSQTTPKRHSVGFYADQLAISAKYLTIICKKYSGKTAIEWIHEYVLEEVRYYLSQYGIEVNRVADLTGFENASFFSRFVKNYMGCTPLEYRKKVK